MSEYVGGMKDWYAHNEPVERSGPDGAARPLSAQAAARPDRRALGDRLRLADFFERLASWSFGALFALWLAMVSGFGCAYWLAGAWRPSLLEAGVPVTPTLRGLTRAIYFSFVTATSVGFGDVVPTGPVRVLAIAEAVAGLLLFGCVISKLVSRRQEMLVEETHRIAFEDRLGRVQMNLHMIILEFERIASAAREDGFAAERVLPAVESSAMVFAGQLRTIHDLLFRPQQLPDEEVLEAILAALSGALARLAGVLRVVSPDGRQPPLLRSTLERVRRLASEICGDCVPREHAEHLRDWMDRIQQAARDF